MEQYNVIIISTTAILSSTEDPSDLCFVNLTFFMVRRPFGSWRFPAIDYAPQLCVMLYRICLHDSDSRPERTIPYIEITVDVHSSFATAHHICTYTYVYKIHVMYEIFQ